MKLLLILSLIIVLSACASESSSSKVSQTLDSWKQQAALYPGNNPDLSDASKRAIVLGDPSLAEKSYLKAYNSAYGRKQFGVESLYQIFLIYLDPHNSARDVSVAKKYLDKMLSEWPNTEQTRKAKALYEQSNT